MRSDLFRCPRSDQEQSQLDTAMKKELIQFHLRAEHLILTRK